MQLSQTFNIYTDIIYVNSLCVNINKADVNIVVLHVDTKKVIYVNIIMLYVDRDNYHVNI